MVIFRHLTHCVSPFGGGGFSRQIGLYSPLGAPIAKLARGMGDIDHFTAKTIHTPPSWPTARTRHLGPGQRFPGAGWWGVNQRLSRGEGERWDLTLTVQASSLQSHSNHRSSTRLS